tara:strand:+ start:1146 stop:2351 length:1206 start_codon:yes stop_codon:yes gene_type:complete
MIKTCVIFCGGLGTRLGSITKKIPKPMVLINNKPFLEHLLMQVKDLGIKNVYLCVGYKKDKIINYFKDGKKLGLKIHYSYSPPESKTGYRLNLIKKKIKENFLLMYCDNYCPINIEKNFLLFKEKKSLVTLSICEKNKGNILISNNKIKYKLKRQKEYKFVEIGYMICNRKLLNYVNNKNINLNEYFVKKNISSKISAIIIHNKYLSISDQKRLTETRKYFRKKNIILIDRDGVLNLKNKFARYIRKTNEINMNNKIISILKKYPKIKYVCISNQAGISTGEVKRIDLKKINAFIKSFLKEKKINLIDFYISTDHFNSNSFYRKPNPGNFLEAAKKYHLLLDKTFYIGDDPRDVIASFNANTKCVYTGNKNDLKNFIKPYMKGSMLKNLSKSIELKLNSNY